MAPSQYTRIVLAERPKGNITPQTFRKEVVPFNLKPQAKQIIVKTLYLSMDPTQRMWLNDSRNYMDPVKVGDIMRGSGLGVVLEAGPGSRFKAGNIVDGLIG
jgi:NADPH-dependent curcumin reductase CurA